MLLPRPALEVVANTGTREMLAYFTEQMWGSSFLSGIKRSHQARKEGKEKIRADHNITYFWFEHGFVSVRT